VTETLRVQAIAALVETVRAALRDGDALRLRISGPAALHARFAAALGDDAARFRFEPSDSLDLTVSLDNRLYATRLEEWAAALAEMKP
jgi:hypothetical protein